MNRSELVAAIAEKTGSSKKVAADSLRALIEVVSEELKNDGKVQVVGFGTCEIRKRASKAPVFKAGKAFKDVVNK